MTGGWRCDSCHANNEADAVECRLCHEVPGSATGTAEQVADAFVPTMRTEPEPEYVESQHGHFRPAQTPSRPLMPIGGAPPRPPIPRPLPVPRSKDSRFGVIFSLVAVVAITVVIIASALTTHHEPSGGGLASSDVSVSDVPPVDPVSSSPVKQSGPPCPDAAASYLPDSGSGSVLVVEYSSPQFTITLCQADNGQLYYDGQLIGAAPSDTTHISIPAEQTASGYTAFNNGYTYDIGDTEEQLIYGGQVVEAFPLTRTGP